MVLEIERYQNVDVTYQGIKAHWEAPQIATATTRSREAARRPPSYAVDDVQQASRSEGDGDCG